MADPLHQFQIQKIVPLDIAGIDVSFTNSSLWMMIAVITSIVFMTIATRKPALVPGRVQMCAEGLYEFIAGMIRKRTRIFPAYLYNIYDCFIGEHVGNVALFIHLYITYCRDDGIGCCIIYFCNNFGIC